MSIVLSATNAGAAIQGKAIMIALWIVLVCGISLGIETLFSNASAAHGRQGIIPLRKEIPLLIATIVVLVGGIIGIVLLPNS